MTEEIRKEEVVETKEEDKKEEVVVEIEKEYPKISEALVNVYLELRNPINSVENDFYDSKYAPLSEVLNTIRPVLAKHDLAFIQIPMSSGRTVAVKTIIIHKSGEKWELPPFTTITDKATAQGIGSALTYARRYALSSIFGVASENDDDGNEAEGGNPIEKEQKYKKLMSDAALLGQQFSKQKREQELVAIINSNLGRGKKMNEATVGDLDKIEKTVEAMKKALK